MRGEEQRRGEAALVPRVDARGARAQVVSRQRLDDGERVRQRAVLVMLRCVSRVRPRAVAAAREPVDDERLQPVAEDAAEIAFERVDRRPECA